MQLNTINLKLAEYKSLGEINEGKFIHFHYLDEKGFGYFRDKIAIFNESNGEYLWFEKDQKDPLNRFDGLFSGRT